VLFSFRVDIEEVFAGIAIRIESLYRFPVSALGVFVLIKLESSGRVHESVLGVIMVTVLASDEARRQETERHGIVAELAVVERFEIGQEPLVVGDHGCGGFGTGRGGERRVRAYRRGHEATGRACVRVGYVDCGRNRVGSES
jgi:hypothetical protein